MHFQPNNEHALYELKATGCSVSLRMYTMCLFALIKRVDGKDRMISFQTGNTEIQQNQEHSFQ